MATEIESLLISLKGDASGYLSSLKEAEGATRATAAKLEGDTTQATKAVASSQTQLAASYAKTGQAAVASASQQVTAFQTAQGVVHDAAEAAAINAHEQQKMADAMKRGAAIFQAVMTPLEQYKAKIKELNELLKQGAISQETFDRAKRKAAQETGQQGGLSGMMAGMKSFSQGAMGAMRALGPIAAIGAAVVKVGGAIADAVVMTTAFRQKLIDLAHAGDEAASAFGRLTQTTTRQLARSDKPIAERRLEIEKKLIEAMKRREGFRKDSEGQEIAKSKQDQWWRLDTHVGKAFAPGTYALRDAAAENAKKLTQKAEEDVEAFRKQKQELEEQLKDSIFQQQAQSREEIALARVPEHLKGGEKLRRMGAAEADIKQTQQLSTQAMTTRFAADTDKASRMLDLQAKNLAANSAELRVMEMALEGVTGKELELAKVAAARNKAAEQNKAAAEMDRATRMLGLQAANTRATSNELKVLEMALDGVTGKQLEMARAAAQANKVGELRLNIAQTNQQLTDQIAVLGKTASFAQLYAFKIRGASDADLALTKALGQQMRGAELREQFLSPPEKFIKSMAELNELYQNGAIDQLTYSRAAKDARKQLEGQRQELQAIQGAASGSAESLERFNKFQDAIRIKPIFGIEDAQRAVDAQKFKLAGGAFQGQAGGLGVGGMQAAPPPRMMERNPPAMGGADQKQTNEYLRRIMEATERTAANGLNIGLGLGV